MEIFGIPVVLTVRDVIGLGGYAIAMVMISVLLMIMLVLELTRQFKDWRRNHRCL